MTAMLRLIIVSLLSILAICSILQVTYAQTVENWNTFVDPEKRFTLFYPPTLKAQGKENFLSSTDLTLTSPNSSRVFKITITYSVNDTNLNYTSNQEIVPEKDLKNLEQQIKPAFQLYNLVQNNSGSYNLYGFPTSSNIIDYTKHDGESGRALNIVGVIQGKNSFLFSYSNTIEEFYRYLPTIAEIVKSIVILK